MVGRERIEETIDPEQAIDRALETYLKKGYSEEWVHQRLLAIRIRNELTDEWKKRGVQKGKEYAILTDEITRAWAGMITRQYKNLEGLKKENLRDNMSDLELVLTMLAESSTTDIAKAEQPQGFDENQKVARRGGNVAGVARKALEAESVASMTRLLPPELAEEVSPFINGSLLTAEEKRAWLDAVTGVSLGSDAFFPVCDNNERARRSGVTAIVQPGGSIRDQQVIDTCNKYGIAMAFCGLRLFHH